MDLQRRPSVEGLNTGRRCSTSEGGKMIEEISLTEPQRTALLTAVRKGGRVSAASRVVNELRSKGLVESGGMRWTKAGRRCVQWFADDCAEHWGVTPATWNTYVRRGTAPEPYYAGTLRSTIDRAWWKPAAVREYTRPGSQAGPESQRAQLDHSEVLRVWRDPGLGGRRRSLQEVADRFGVSATTMAALLERMGEKPATSASLRAGNGPNVRAGAATDA